MKKSSFLTMVAASLVCGVAFAQAPTVYGVADLSVDSSSATGSTGATSVLDVPTRTRLQANSSLLGVKGKFDLGGGTAAIYQFETYVDLGSNQAGANMATPIAGTTTIATSGTVSPLQSMFGARRDTFVGLTGEWGTLRAGYLTTGFRGAVAKCDLAVGATGVAAAYEVFGFAANPAAGGATYFNRYNAVNYSTPDMGGFSVSVNYLVDTAKSANNATNQVDPGGWDALARFETKLFHVTVVHTNLKDQLFGGQAHETNKADTLLASVMLPTGTTISGMYNVSKSNLQATPVAVEVETKQNSFYIGVKQVVGPHEFMVNYQSAGKTKRAGADLADTSASMIGARYGYNVIKNVQVYGVYSKITNEVASRYNFNVGGITGTATGSDPQTVGLGLRVSF